MTASQIAQIAARQLSDYDARRPGGIFAEAGFTLTVEEAYAVQRAVAALRVARGEAIAGYKIGCVSRTVQEQLGITAPIFGHLFASELYPSGVVLDAARFCELAIEGEIAVRVGAGLEIEAVFPVIELHHAVFRGAQRTAAELIANNALQAGVVLSGAECPPESATVEVYRNGALLGSAAAADVRTSVQWVAGHGGAPAPGLMVLTGSLLPLYPASPGDHFLVRGGDAASVQATVRPSRRAALA